QRCLFLRRGSPNRKCGIKRGYSRALFGAHIAAEITDPLGKRFHILVGQAARECRPVVFRDHTAGPQRLERLNRYANPRCCSAHRHRGVLRQLQRSNRVQVDDDGACGVLPDAPSLNLAARDSLLERELVESCRLARFAHSSPPNPLWNKTLRVLLPGHRCPCPVLPPEPIALLLEELETGPPPFVVLDQPHHQPAKHGGESRQFFGVLEDILVGGREEVAETG